MSSPNPATLRALVKQWAKARQQQLDWHAGAEAAHDGASAHTYLARANVYRRCIEDLETALASPAPEPTERSKGQPLCKCCFARINENGFALDGGQDIADRLKEAVRSAGGKWPSAMTP